jgi:hypothetical protein
MAKPPTHDDVFKRMVKTPHTDLATVQKSRLTLPAYNKQAA